jgi:asparagine synthase (glutamine-hydrolysing)
MCGIAGELSWGGQPNTSAVRAMTARLAHRGPDAEGFQTLGPLSLGHRRLTVIDISEASNQPLCDETGRYWIVFNGEIYNYRHLRSELEARGSRFRTQGDTEVIVEAYKLWGLDMLGRLNGMFAFALWDESEQCLVLARDRLGEKPLYFTRTPNGSIIFASELQALRAHPSVSDRINPSALGQYLSLNYTLTDCCILKDVEKLPAAHYLVAEREREPKIRSYWDLAPFFLDKRSFEGREQAVEELGALIDDATKLRLVSDVPLGAFLSGGVDSSIVVESMSRLRPPAQSKTFSIGFEEDTYSELDKARAISSLLGVDHHDRTVTVDMAQSLPNIVHSADEPFADTSMIPVYYLAQFAREHVTVCLSGDGADETFAGYPTYKADRLYRWIRRAPRPLIGVAQSLVGRHLAVSFDKVSFDYKLRRFLEGLYLEPEEAHHHWRTIFTPAEKNELLRPEFRQVCQSSGMETFARFHQDVADCNFIDQAMYVDIKTWLVDDILVKVDRSTMAHSLEARTPFLDHRLVEFAASLPTNWKLDGGETKALLRRRGAAIFGQAHMNQKKQGFNAPVNHWLASELEPLARSVLTESPLTEWLAPDSVDTMWKDHKTGQKDHGLKLFGLTCLGLWMSQPA